jgi:hypothetical protein
MPASTGLILGLRIVTPYTVVGRQTARGELLVEDKGWLNLVDNVIHDIALAYLLTNSSKSEVLAIRVCSLTMDHMSLASLMTELIWWCAQGA